MGSMLNHCTIHGDHLSPIDPVQSGSHTGVIVCLRLCQAVGSMLDLAAHVVELFVYRSGLLVGFGELLEVHGRREAHGGQSLLYAATQGSAACDTQVN